MENDHIVSTNPEMIRLMLKAHDEIVCHLQTLVSNLSNENYELVQRTLMERLLSLEKMERQLWITLFPPGSVGFPENGASDATTFPSEHRMTMHHHPEFHQYY